MNPTRLAALGLMLTTLAASGCGGSTKSPSQATPTTQAASTASAEEVSHAQHQTPPLTKSQLIAKADTICRRVNAKRASIIIKTPQDFPRLLPGLATYEYAAVVEMRKLTPPASMKTSWQKIITGAKLTADAAAARGKYVTTTNPDGMGPLSLTAAHTAQESLALAQREGFHDCSKP